MTPSSQNPRSILFLGSQMEIGGAQKNLLMQAEWFHNQGYRVTVAFLYDKAGMQKQWQARYPFPIIDLKARRFGATTLANFFFLISGLSRTSQLFLREKFDAVETFTHHANLIGIPLAWLARVPVRIASHHGRIRGFPDWQESIHNRMINAGMATHLVTVSQEVCAQAVDAGVQPQRIAVIPNGVDFPEVSADARELLRAGLGIQPGQLVILSAGRLNYEKGHSFLIDAMPQVLAARPDAVLLMAGDGPLRAELTAQAQALSLGERVKFLGVRSDVPELMAASDVFVLPSRSEGMPTVILEAMAMRLPVVAAQVGGVGEVVKTDETGWLTPPENPAALAQGILKLGGDPALRARLGEAGRRVIEESHSLDMMCQRYAALLDPGRPMPPRPMRLAYISMHWPRTLESGVGRKIDEQVKQWRKEGNEVEFFMHSHPLPEKGTLLKGQVFLYRQDRGLIHLLSNELSRIRATRDLLKAVARFKPDLVYLRSAMYTYPLHRLFRIAPVVEEINTNDTAQHRFLGKIYSYYNDLTRAISLRDADGLVCVSEELAASSDFARYHKPTRVIANGIDLSTIQPLPPTHNQTPEMAFIGTPGFTWHGVDKLEKLAQRYPDLTIHIIGMDQPEETIPANLHFHGYLTVKEYEQIYARCDVSFGTLALHRKDMEEACPLKVRESLAYGIPTILPYKDTDLYNLESDCLLTIPNTEDNVERYGEQIHEFAYRMIGRRVERALIAPRLDAAAKEKQRLAFFHEILTNRKQPR